MRKILIFFSVTAIIILSGCSKKEHSVQICVKNSTFSTVTDIKLGDALYGTLSPGETSSYHSFNDLINVPVMTFDNGKDSIILFIGECYTGVSSGPSYMENGRYQYSITKDSTHPQGFWFSFQKE